MSICLKKCEEGSLLRISVATDFWISRQDVFSLWRYSQTNSENTWVAPKTQACYYCISRHTLPGRQYSHLLKERGTNQYSWLAKLVFTSFFCDHFSFIHELHINLSEVPKSHFLQTLLRTLWFWNNLCQRWTAVLVMMVPSFLFIFNNPHEDTIVR